VLSQINSGEIQSRRIGGPLSSAEQKVLLHCVQLGMSHDEAAYVLSMPLGTVKSHAICGKAKLRTLLADWHVAPEEESGS
jgi:RNA polymerase sigma-70 factor (ECF subfamily)